MAGGSCTSIRHALLTSLTALALLGATLPGCLATSMIEKSAMGEPKEAVRFALSTGANTYEITRWWDAGQETLSIPRGSLPAGCDAARFFLNDSAHELQIAQPASAKWETGVRPPVPDDSYPPCALLVSYGSFSESPALEGVAVTSVVGLIAKSERKRPNPAAYALMPAGIAADFYLFVGGVVTMPVWAPIALISESSEAKEKQEKKAEAKGKLPPPVAACWTAVDSAMEKPGFSNPHQPFCGFEWVPDGENAYVLATASEVFSDDTAIPIDAWVTLSQGRVRFPVDHNGSLWTDADVECGLRAGDVVATSMKLRK